MHYQCFVRRDKKTCTYETQKIASYTNVGDLYDIYETLIILLANQLICHQKAVARDRATVLSGHSHD